MAVQDFDVRRYCELAALELSPEESARFKKQLEAVVDYVQKIKEVDVSGVAPTVQGQPVQSVFREDRLERSLDRETALRNAPQRIENEFKVPRIVE